MKKTSLLIVATALALSACEAGRQNHARWDIEGVEKLPAPAEQVLDQLAQGYLDLARDERAEGDWDDAEFYVARARSLKEGTDLSVQSPDERNLTNGKDEILTAYESFMSVSRGTALVRAPEELVTAQIAFDCWIQEQEENQQQEHVDVCRDRFNSVIESLKKKSTIGKDIFVLLPDDDGKIGELSVSVEGQEVVLDKALAAAHIVSAGLESLDVTEGEVDSIFGQTLAAKPKRPVSFQLYFEKGTSMLTPESETMLGKINDELKSRDAAVITVIGHTDSTGPAATNDRLSKERAAYIKTFLIERGFGDYAITTAGRGERELLVKTGNSIDEPKNRRVEVSIR